MFLISCHIMSFIIFKSFSYSCHFLLCFMPAYTLEVDTGTITVGDNDFYMYDPNGAAIMIQTGSMSSTQTGPRYL